jgi:IstB-like ATP binding protein
MRCRPVAVPQTATGGGGAPGCPAERDGGQEPGTWAAAGALPCDAFKRCRHPVREPASLSESRAPCGDVMAVIGNITWKGRAARPSGWHGSATPSAKGDSPTSCTGSFRIAVLVVDEVGYMPFDPAAANLMFSLVSSRYERASLIVTSNKPFSSWGEIFGDGIVAAAMIDRSSPRRDPLAQRRQLAAQRPRTSAADRPLRQSKPPDQPVAPALAGPRTASQSLDRDQRQKPASGGRLPSGTVIGSPDGSFVTNPNPSGASRTSLSYFGCRPRQG